MKTVVSIPDDLFHGVERLARRTKKSRSRLFSDALRKYMTRHDPQEITEAMNRACANEAVGEIPSFPPLPVAFWSVASGDPQEPDFTTPKWRQITSIRR